MKVIVCNKAIGASGLQAIGGGVAGTYFTGAVFGGIGAELSGGEFWKGAATGAIIAGLNHLHKIFSDSKLRKMYSVYQKSIFEHNSPEGFYESIGGNLGTLAAVNPQEFLNTCAARLSKALNYGGFEIPKGTPDTYLGGDGKSYFIQAKAMSVYLSNSKVWGTPVPLKHYSLKNGLFFQTGFGSGVTGHLDIMYRGNAANHFNANKPTVYWH